MASTQHWLTHISLAPYTTFALGGNAQYFYEAKSLTELQTAFVQAHKQALPISILGGGSNVVISDQGLKGLVLQYTQQERSVTITDNKVDMRVTAGIHWDDLVAYTVEQQFAGLECLSGIPGWVGAAPIQNIGAYGQEVKDTIVQVEAMHRQTLQIKYFSNEESLFAYRQSYFKQAGKDAWVITAVTFRLTLKGAPTLKYPELLQTFEGAKPTLVQVRQAVLDLRRSKSMIYDVHDENHRSAGSFFMNPIVTVEQCEKLLKKLPQLPHYKNGDLFKLSAAYLIEQAGFQKGFRLGEVGISKKHALALINCGNGTTQQLLALMQHIQQEVLAQFDITLQPEPEFLGNF